MSTASSPVAPTANSAQTWPRAATNCCVQTAQPWQCRPLARVRETPNTEVRRLWLPEEWPDEAFDLIVVSEVAYCLSKQQLDNLVRYALRVALAHTERHRGGLPLASSHRGLCDGWRRGA